MEILYVQDKKRKKRMRGWRLKEATENNTSKGYLHFWSGEEPFYVRVVLSLYEMASMSNKFNSLIRKTVEKKMKTIKNKKKQDCLK